jgi:hypothetical protein
MANIYETLVRWYLRFNGYASVENFVINETSADGAFQAGESDILAVRFPYSVEAPGFKLRNDPRLVAKSTTGTVDFVIAEVKGGRRASINDVWRPGGDIVRKRSMVKYLIRWLGPLRSTSAIDGVSADLQSKFTARYGRHRFRLVLFAHRPLRAARDLAIPTITFQQIAEFIVNDRAGCWTEHGIGVRSPHDQWDQDINAIWRLAEPNESPARRRAELIVTYLREKSEIPRRQAEDAL